MQPESLTRLTAAFRKLPAVGQKTALRYAYSIIDMPKEDVDDFLDAVRTAKDNVRFCSVCGDYTEGEAVCPRCQENHADVICVVKEPKDILAIEKMGAFQGAYHVLHGALDFQKGVGPDQLRIKELLSRLDGNVKEVIIATNYDISGEMTATYLSQLLKPLGVKVSRLAYGISMGTEIEFTDEMTLQKAFLDRKSL